MEREHGTERLADASFLEELLRGRRTLVIAFGDTAPAQHLHKRLSPTPMNTAEMGADGRVPAADRSADAVIALGGFEDPDVIERLLDEARRILVPGGFFAASWVDASRPSLESEEPAGTARGALTPADATRRLATRFPWVAVVARQPYLGFQYVTGVDAGGAVALDSSLTGGGSESPTGFLALAADAGLPIGDLLVQVPYDRAVSRVQQRIQLARQAVSASPVPAPVAQNPFRGGQPVARPRDGGNELERLRAETNGLRERAQAAVEDADRARGEARSARERTALLEAEVAKLRSRLRGEPAEDLAEIKTSLEARIRERDQARRDAEGAAAEAARALEAAARYERDVDFLTQRVEALEKDTAQAHEDAERAIAQVRGERDAARKELEAAKKELVAARKDLEAARRSVEEARRSAQADTAATQRAEAAEAKVAELEARIADQAKRATDGQRRSDQALKRLEEAQRKVADLEAAKIAAERSAEDAWKRLKEAQAAPAAPAAGAADMVPAADLAAAERALAEAIGRAETAEKELRVARETAAEAAKSVAAPKKGAAARKAADAAPELAQALEELSELKGTLSAVRQELDATRARADSADARATSAQRLADEARGALDAARAKSAAPDAEGLRSLLHQRETAMAELRERMENAEARAARFTTEAEEARKRVQASEDALAGREADLKRALGGLDEVESRAAREKELNAELKGEIARLTEALASAREDLQRAGHRGGSAEGDEAGNADASRAFRDAGTAQAEAARAHAEADALRERLAMLQAEMDQLRGEAGKRGAQEEERERRIADLEQKLLEARTKGDGADLERRAVSMAQKMALLEADLERAKDDLKQATAEARKYRALAEAIDPPADRPVKLSGS